MTDTGTGFVCAACAHRVRVICFNLSRPGSRMRVPRGFAHLPSGVPVWHTILGDARSAKIYAYMNAIPSHMCECAQCLCVDKLRWRSFTPPYRPPQKSLTHSNVCGTLEHTHTHTLLSVAAAKAQSANARAELI